MKPRSGEPTIPSRRSLGSWRLAILSHPLISQHFLNTKYTYRWWKFHCYVVLPKGSIPSLETKTQQLLVPFGPKLFFGDVISHDSCITIPEGSKSGYSPKNKDDNRKSTMNEEWRCMFPIENDDFPASQVKRCCGSPSQGPRQAVEIQRKMVDNGILWFLFQIYLHTNIHMYINIYICICTHFMYILYTCVFELSFGLVSINPRN